MCPFSLVVAYNSVSSNLKEKLMENDLDFDLEDRENFRINPEVWLRTLLAITGDKEKKEEVVRKIAQTTGFSHEKVELIIMTTIGILMNDTRAN